jgi:CRP/FNR family cyclic AMP-dependent transcriptional regulator
MNSPYGLPAECVTCPLRSDNFFCALSHKSLKAFHRIKHAAVFPEGAVIFVEGQSPRGIFMLCQGQAKLSTTSREGKSFILRIAKPGEVLGLHAIFTGKPYEATVETIEPSQLNFVNREDFLRFLKENGDACLHAAQQVSRECQDAYDMVRSIGLSHSISARVGQILAPIGGPWAGQERTSPRKARADPRGHCSTHWHLPGNHNAHTFRIQTKRHSRTEGLYLDHQQQACAGAAHGGLSQKGNGSQENRADSVCSSVTA